jgi:hypothetical protein
MQDSNLDKKNSKLERDLLIDCLEYGRKTFSDPDFPNGATDQDYLSHLTKCGHDMKNRNMIRIMNHVLSQACLTQSSSQRSNGAEYVSHHQLKVDAYFSLLDYYELQEARSSSKLAKCVAIVSILLTIVTLGVSIYFSIAQLNNSSKFETNQFGQLIDALKNSKANTSKGK